MEPAFVLVCPRCGYSNDITATKCVECGARLPGRAGEQASPKTPGKKSKWADMFGGVVVLLFVLGFLTIGAPVDLTCTRFEWQGPVTCTRRTRLFWIYPAYEQTITDVRGARLTESSDDEGTAYRVELLTAGGEVPLSAGYTSGSSAKTDVVNKVNSFVYLQMPGALAVTEPGILSFETIGWGAIWFVVWAGWNLVRRAVKGEAKGRREESKSA